MLFAGASLLSKDSERVSDGDSGDKLMWGVRRERMLVMFGERGDCFAVRKALMKSFGCRHHRVEILLFFHFLFLFHTFPSFV